MPADKSNSAVIPEVDGEALGLFPHELVRQESEAILGGGNVRREAQRLLNAERANDGGLSEADNRLRSARTAVHDAAFAEAQVAHFMREDAPPLLEKVGSLYEAAGRFSPIPEKLRQARENYAFIPVLAQHVAHAGNPNVSLSYPTADDIKELRPSLGTLSNWLGDWLGDKLDDMIERKVEMTFRRAVATFTAATDYLEKIPNPRQQFVEEIAKLYRGMSASGMPPQQYFETVAGQLDDLKYGRLGDLPDWRKTITAENYPMMVYAVKDYLIPRRYRYRGSGYIGLVRKIGLAGPEIAHGLEAFLHQQGVPDILEAQVERPTGLTRRLAERFAASKLEQAEAKIPAVLSAVTDLLPEDGPEFSRKLQGLAANIALLKQQGGTDEQIEQLIFGPRT